MATKLNAYQSESLAIRGLRQLVGIGRDITPPKRFYGGGELKTKLVKT